MIKPDSLFGAFVLAVHRMRDLQTTALDELSAEKMVALDQATAEVDWQLYLFLTPSVMQDQWGEIIAATRQEHN